MKDRLPANPGRVKFTLDDGTILNGILVRDDNPQEEGTPLNKATLFDSEAETRYNADTPSAAFKRMAQSVKATIPASGWSNTPDADGWYTNQVTVSGMKEVYNPLMDLEITSSALAEDEKAAFGCIIECETFDGYVIARCLDVPDVDVNVRFTGV